MLSWFPERSKDQGKPLLLEFSCGHARRATANVHKYLLSILKCQDDVLPRKLSQDCILCTEIAGRLLFQSRDYL